MAGNSGKIRCADVQPDLYGGPFFSWLTVRNGQDLRTLSIIFEKSYACIFVPVWQTESELVVNTELSTGSPHSMR
jgi:hypothetical protein